MFLFGDHLQQDAARDVGVVLLVDDDEIDPFDDQASDVRQRDVPAFDGVVQPAVGVLFDHSRIAHGAPRSCLADAQPKDAGACPMPMMTLSFGHQAKG